MLELKFDVIKRISAAKMSYSFAAAAILIKRTFFALSKFADRKPSNLKQIINFNIFCCNPKMVLLLMSVYTFSILVLIDCFLQIPWFKDKLIDIIRRY